MDDRDVLEQWHARVATLSTSTCVLLKKHPNAETHGSIPRACTPVEELSLVRLDVDVAGHGHFQ